MNVKINIMLPKDMIYNKTDVKNLCLVSLSFFFLFFFPFFPFPSFSLPLLFFFRGGYRKRGAPLGAGPGARAPWAPWLMRYRVGFSDSSSTHRVPRTYHATFAIDQGQTD